MLDQIDIEQLAANLYDEFNNDYALSGGAYGGMSLLLQAMGLDDALVQSFLSKLVDAESIIAEALEAAQPLPEWR